MSRRNKETRSLRPASDPRWADRWYDVVVNGDIVGTIRRAGSHDIWDCFYAGRKIGRKAGRVEAGELVAERSRA